MDGDDASNGNFQPRYHMRYYWNIDPTWGIYTLATPHHEDYLPDPIGHPSCGHAVDSNNNEPPGGFVMAKWDIGYNWHDWNGGGGTHLFGGSQFWGNTQQMLQCDGEYAWNDGYVDFVQIN